MKTFALVALLAATAFPSFAQYSARTLTRRIAPQTQRPPPSRPPQQAAPPQAPPPAAPQQQFYPQQQYAPVPQAAAARPAPPVDSAKAAAEKAKNDEKQFDYFKRRAEEGSDHAQYEVGVRYLTGRGVNADEKLGREWLAKAAKNGNSSASKKLAELGVEPEKVEVKSAEPAPKLAEPAGKAEATSKPEAK